MKQNGCADIVSLLQAIKCWSGVLSTGFHLHLLWQHGFLESSSWGPPPSLSFRMRVWSGTLLVGSGWRKRRSAGVQEWRLKMNSGCLVWESLMQRGSLSRRKNCSPMASTISTTVSGQYYHFNLSRALSSGIKVPAVLKILDDYLFW